MYWNTRDDSCLKLESSSIRAVLLSRLPDLHDSGADIGALSSWSRSGGAASILALLLSIIWLGCENPDDDDSLSDDDAQDDDCVSGDDDDDDDADGKSSIHLFEPSTVVFGTTPPFTATGSFCPDTEICVSGTVQTGPLCVVQYTVQDGETIEGVLPSGLELGLHDIMADCPYGWDGFLKDGLEVIE